MKFVCVPLLVSLLLSAYLPLLNPGDYWIAGFAPLAFPLLFLLCLLSLSFWIWRRKKRYVFYTIAALLLCLRPALRTWGFHILPKDNITKTSGSREFTLMTYNTSSMGLQSYKINPQIRAAVFQQINESRPDILCMQEFYTNDHPELSNHIDSLRNIGQYPYHYFTCDQVSWNTWYYGIVLFSRYPIAAATAIPCDEEANGSGRSFLQADIVIQQDTVRVFSVQFTSYMFSRNDYSNLRSHPVLVMGKMKRTFRRRTAQARQLASLVAASPYPVIVAGDFNDPPASYSYHTAAAGLQDVFLQTGFGWGRTLSYLSPTLRIDYILPDQHFDIKGCRVLKTPTSEHFPVISRLSLKKH
ncbi:endonuclease/exonuclease/phosphatase family protein [Chitinophaga sp. HK235]|uniref:endonuclease/exonuclease/phosphatase family protein n=1 Tax=Chitinophaga sp. HK235 TaxID=2952571 RepID=UPI001BA8E533|nr:endonuclease/exonuclease/phosphatase family protein [Chitinophaga sp. HK235]